MKENKQLVKRLVQNRNQMTVGGAGHKPLPGKLKANAVTKMF